MTFCTQYFLSLVGRYWVFLTLCCKQGYEGQKPYIIINHIFWSEVCSCKGEIFIRQTTFGERSTTKTLIRFTGKKHSFFFSNIVHINRDSKQMLKQEVFFFRIRKSTISCQLYWLMNNKGKVAESIFCKRGHLHKSSKPVCVNVGFQPTKIWSFGKLELKIILFNLTLGIYV